MDDLANALANLGTNDWVTLVATGCFLLGILMISAAGGLKRAFLLVVGAIFSLAGAATLVAASMMG
jgi:hypothetical protein